MATPGRLERSLDRRSVRSGGVERSYWVRAPPSTPAPVVLALHGRGATPTWHAWFTRSDRLADLIGAAVVFPQGGRVWDRHGFDWDREGDGEYLLAVIDAARAEFGTPHARVSLTGMSAGARMSCHLASAHAESVAAVAAVGGLRAPSVPPSQPIRVLGFHGTADRANPYDGGSTDRWRESVPDAARAWARANGDPADPVVVRVRPHAVRATYGAGRPGEVTLWTLEGAGHTWPGRAGTGLVIRWFLGRTSYEVDATEEIGRFLRPVPTGEPTVP